MLGPLLPAMLVMGAVASDYAGAAACRKCHAAEFAAHSSSAHWRALAVAKAPQPGDWAFGAGSQAVTFVMRVGADTYLELAESWYRALDGYAPTPGHRGAGGVRYRTFDPDAGIMRCFACHSTGPLAVARDGAITPHEAGVRCEGCHGGAAAHLREPAKFHPRNPGRMTADQLNNFCGACHRMPAGAGDTPDLRDPWNVRHQPLLLAASACFRESQGGLSCLTCHSPHAALETKLEAYDAVCARCHAAPKHSQPIAGRACAECHMPVVRPQPNLEFSNHRIAIYQPADPLSPVSAGR
jgi:hypothetical protein